MNSIGKLIELFQQFPGIGPRQAKRFVYFLLAKHPEFLEDLAVHIKKIKSEVTSCKKCFRYFTLGRNASSVICPTCSDSNRNKDLLMIVSRDVDYENIEKSGIYNGYYFVLGGTVPILDKEPYKKIRASELISRLEQGYTGGTIKEIIIATSLNPEGENTAKFITELIEPLANQYDTKISALGRGLSTGTELEYSDAETIRQALQNRK